MKFIEQLDDNRFIVELGEVDDRKEPWVVVAHDYVCFHGRDWHCEDYQVKGPHGSSNIVHNHASVQIPIRMAQDMLRTILKRDYLQPKHLKKSNGDPAYLYDGSYMNRYMYWTDDHVQMVAVMDQETGEFHHMPRSLYDSIREVKTKEEHE